VPEVDIIDLQGDPYVRGRYLGVARRARIHACLTDWLASLEKAGVSEPAKYLAGMLKATCFMQSIREHVPELLEEVQGIADGAAQPFDLLLAAQMMDEEWAYRAGLSTNLEALQKCSSVAVRAPDESIVVGQNMDLADFTDGHQIVLRIEPRGAEPGALIFTITSMIALFGVNTHQIAVCVNSVPQLPAQRQGVPVAFVVRRLLQARTLSEAVEMVHGIAHATAQHYLIADARTIRSFEASPAGVTEYYSPHPAAVLHTNHPLVSALGSFDSNENSSIRLRSLSDRLYTGQPDLEAVKAALSSCDDSQNPVSRTVSASARPSQLTGAINFTTGSMISTLRRGASEIEVWISPGPPSVRGYSRFTLPCTA
jgi:predicted choloylglycine hydrolase